MSTKIHICTERKLSPELRQAAATTAIRENPENQPQIFPSAMHGVMVKGSMMALLTGKKWSRGRTLRVAFLDGIDAVQAKVAEIAQIWEKFAEVDFKFVNSDKAEIRISFDETSGSWSYLGTDALLIPSGEATMNYGWLFENTSDEEYHRVVLHEFGHALGCIHEHQHPQNPIPWDKPKVYQFYWDALGWDKPMVDQNIFEKYSDGASNFSEYDRDSIMHYPVSEELTIGNYSVGWNRDLSATDKAYIAKVY